MIFASDTNIAQKYAQRVLDRLTNTEASTNKRGIRKIIFVS
jgi:hypothetical protein